MFVNWACGGGLFAVYTYIKSLPCIHKTNIVYNYVSIKLGKRVLENYPKGSSFRH